MKREYEAPDFEVVHFDSQDILTTESNGKTQDNGSVGNVLGSFF